MNSNKDVNDYNNLFVHKLLKHFTHKDISATMNGITDISATMNGLTKKNSECR